MSKKSVFYEIEELIDIIKQYPIVYSRGLVANNNEKNLVWMEIAEKLNEDDPIKLKQKWRNLRDSYQKAVKYKKDLEEIGQLSKYHPYRHEERMSFLMPHVLADIREKKKKLKGYHSKDAFKSEKTIKNESITYAIESPQEVEYVIEDSDYSEMKRDEDNVASVDIIYKESEEEMECNNTDTIELEPESICYEEIGSCSEQEGTEKVSEIAPKTAADDLNIWLSSIRTSLSKLTKVNRARAKRDINNIISNYEIEQYEAEDV